MVEAMDRGEVSLSAAEQVAALPPTKQREVLTNGHGAAQIAARPSSHSRYASYKHPAIKLENVANEETKEAHHGVDQVTRHCWRVTPPWAGAEYTHSNRRRDHHGEQKES